MLHELSNLRGARATKVRTPRAALATAREPRVLLVWHVHAAAANDAVLLEADATRVAKGHLAVQVAPERGLALPAAGAALARRACRHGHGHATVAGWGARRGTSSC